MSLVWRIIGNLFGTVHWLDYIMQQIQNPNLGKTIENSEKLSFQITKA